MLEMLLSLFSIFCLRGDERGPLITKRTLNMSLVPSGGKGIRSPNPASC